MSANIYWLNTHYPFGIEREYGPIVAFTTNILTVLGSYLITSRTWNQDRGVVIDGIFVDEKDDLEKDGDIENKLLKAGGGTNIPDDWYVFKEPSD